jgi:tRNA dimethylallyltransferase
MSGTAGPPLVALVGPTASGKSDAALALAEALAPSLRVEFVSMDSALVYRGMDIGTAKPDAATRARWPHHVIDCCEPYENYSAARFADEGLAAIEAIRARGALALVCGGTMLYWRALTQGLDRMPPADAALRAALDARARLEGWPALHAELARVDPASAARLAPNDAQRIQRALEVFLASGRPLSAWQRQGAATPPRLGPVLLLSLEPADRGWLHARIAARFEHMLASGFVDELRGLRARGDLHAGLPSMRAVGYRQGWAYLDTAQSPSDFEQFRQSAIAATRQLAKRQLTWLRALPERTLIACDDAPAARRAVIERVRRACGV